MPEATPASPDLSAGINVPAQPAAPAAAAPKTDADNPPWLPDRLKQAREAAQRDLLTQFGVQKPDEIASALKQLKDLQDAKLSDKERTEKQLAELIPKAAESDRWRKRFSDRVAADLAALPENQRAVVTQLAGDDPDQQDKFITAIKMAAAVTPQAPAAPAAPAQPPASPPANTMPAGTPPAPAPGVQTPWERYQALLERNPMGASIFLSANRPAIEASRPQ